MKNKFKKSVAGITAFVSLVVSTVGVNTNAYWTTEPFANGYATAYNATSSNSIYASTNSTVSNTTRSVYISHVNNNANPMSSPYFKSSSNGEVVANYTGSGFKSSKTVHSLAGYDSCLIDMNA